MGNFSICFLLTLLLFSVEKTPAQSFQWAKKAGSYSFDFGFQIGIEGGSDLYVTGKYELNGRFGDTIVGDAGTHDIFLAKYDSSGDFKWVKTAGGAYGDYAHSLCFDSAGNIYITGEMESYDHSPIYFEHDTLYSKGDNDVFLAKYNPDGDLLWAKRVGGGQFNDRGVGISCYGDNLYITGNFQDTADFGNITLVSPVIGDTIAKDIFLAKYNTDGSFQWITQMGGNGYDEGLGVGNDNLGNVYITGYYSDTVDFEGTLLTSAGKNDFYIAKFNSDGIMQWVKTEGDTADNYGKKVAISPSGKVYVIGGNNGVPIFGLSPDSIPDTNTDMFIQCYNTSGDKLWERKIVNVLNGYARGLCIDSYSNIYLTGMFGGRAVFDGKKTLYSSDSSDIFFASYTSTGEFRWAMKVDGSPDPPDAGRYGEEGLAICVDNKDAVYATGCFRNDAVFGDTKLMNFNDHTDVFIAKISQEGLFTGNDPQPSVENSDFVKVYPNPTTGTFTIEVNLLNKGKGKIKIELFNSLGQVVYTRKLNGLTESNIATIELDKTFPLGIYVIKTTVGSKIETTRVVLSG